jgi:hypothetical protein
MNEVFSEFEFVQDLVHKLSYIYRVAQKSVYRKKVEYLPYSSSKQVGFFINDRGMFKVYFHKEMLIEILY